MASTPSIATVLHVTGKAFARDTAGHLRAIRPGDSVREGEVVVTRDGATVELTLANGEHLAVKPDQSVKLDPELLGSGHVDVSENAVAADSIKDVLRLLSEGKDLDLDAPGAGLPGGGVGDEGHNFVRLVRILENVSPLAFAFGDPQATDVQGLAAENSTLTVPAAPTVTILQDANNDGVLNAAELGTATTVAVRVGLPAGAKVGDVIVLSDGSGEQRHVVTGADLTAGHWDTVVARPAEASTLSVSATLVDPAGSVSSPATDAATIYAAAPGAPTVTITQDANNDGRLGSAELGTGTTVSVRVGLPADAQVGDTLVVGDGSSTQTHVLTAGDLVSGFWDTNVARPASGATLAVTATLTNPNGNSSATATDSATVDTSAPAASIGLTHDAASDTGASPTDNLTANPKPVL
ncbi:MAG TPA: retention module-containing protein, partial [Rhodocyclaceae bacterium]|nr:retention module-containing protein [Rhodocyclaceae bacterium]HNF07569.1 retention module-containing protein [Mycobacterium sp.]